MLGVDVPPSVRAHLREEYAGVFGDDRLERHIDDYVGTAVAERDVLLLAQHDPAPAEVLDVGCGYGSFVLVARQHGYRAVGIDLAPTEVAFARERLAQERPDDDPDDAYRLHSATTLPFPDDSFDAVTMWNVLEHLEDRATAIAEAGRVLRPGGSLYLVAPNYAALRREAHYGLPWPPGLTGRAAEAYLRARGRDPRFFREQVFPCTAGQVRRELWAAGFQWSDLTADKLRRPEAIERRSIRSLVTTAHRLGLDRLLASAVSAWVAGPLRGSITVVARKG